MKRSGLKRSGLGMKRTAIKKVGRITQERSDRRVQWIADHPPHKGIGGSTGLEYYWCHICVYFEEEKHVAVVPFSEFVLEHIEPKGHLTLEESQQDNNLGPAHSWCNLQKGSQALCEMRYSPQTGKPNPHILFEE